MGENNNWKPQEGQKIVALIDQPEHKICKGDIHIVGCVEYCCPKGGYRMSLVGISDYVPEGRRSCMTCNKLLIDDVLFMTKNFAPYNPYSNSVSKELAEKAMKPVIEIDRPVKELETINN